MTFQSYAKINLGLYITGKRANGFHELYSIFQEIDLADQITITCTEQEEKIRLTSNKDIPLDIKNTVYKAADCLKHLYKEHLHIHIEKYIPSEAGLGGGSANAAYTLGALNDHFSLGLTKDELKYYAEQIGSDVPFFVDGKQALVSGRGEHVKPIKFSFPYHIVLLKPNNFSCSTQEIFKNYAPFLTLPVNTEAIDQVIFSPTKETISALENHLERPLIDKYPILNQMKNELITQGAFYSAMTGSGSVVFGLFEEKPKLKHSDLYTIYYTQAR